ncbi:MAG: redoxin domain-containing protein [Halococcoides sp.]
MARTGDAAPDFSAPLANGDIESFVLSDRLADEAPIVLAFFPGAFTSVCSHELNELQARLDEFEDAGATLYGLSVDSPFALNAFRDDLGVAFGLLSDNESEIVKDYDAAMDFDDLGVYNVAKRSVFVIDASGEITYDWVSDDPEVEPDYDELVAAAEEAAASAVE